MIIFGLVLLVAAAVAIVVAFAARRRWHAMLGTDTYPVSELRAQLETARGLGGAGGFARAGEVVGTTQPGPQGELKAELSGTACVWYRYAVRRRYWYDSRDAKGNRSREQRTETVADFSSNTPFVVADATGALPVRPEGADVDRAERVLDRFTPHESGSSLSFLGINLGGAGGIGGGIGGGAGTIGYEQEEWVLRPGVRLYVLGEATDRGGELEVGRPANGPYIISTRSEGELSASSRRTQRIAMAVGAVTALAGALALAVGALR